MPTLNPPKCSNSIMSQVPGIGPVLLNNSNYPVNSMYTNNTYLWDGTNWSTTSSSVIDSTGPLPPRQNSCSSEFFGGVGTNQNTVMVFGGQSNSSLLSDTWVFDGTSWTNPTQSGSPSARYSATMSCGTSQLSKVLLFGGKNEHNVLGDTWLWDGYTNTWTQKTLDVSPSPRYGSKLVGHTPSTQRNSILFGGANDTVLFNDTFLWNDAAETWTQLTPTNSPSARFYHAMSKDGANGNVTVLFGGLNQSSVLSDTWIFDGTDWAQQSPLNSPPARYGAHMSYDSNAGIVLLFGGTNGSTVFNDTWKWTGTNWVQL